MTTIRPKRNPHLDPTSLSKSYDTPEESWKRLVIALWHPEYRDRDVLVSLGELREQGY